MERFAFCLQPLDKAKLTTCDLKQHVNLDVLILALTLMKVELAKTFLTMASRLRPQMSRRVKMLCGRSGRSCTADLCFFLIFLSISLC